MDEYGRKVYYLLKRLLLGRMQRGMKEIVTVEARNVFARFGFRKTTMDEIARAAHVAKSSIYHYFTSKEKIFEAIIEQETQTFLMDLRQAVKGEKSSQDKLRAYFNIRLLAMQKTTNIYSAMHDKYFEHYAFIEKVRRKLDAQEMEFLKGILEEGIRTGEFASDDLDIIMVGFHAILRGIEYYYLAVEKRIDKIAEIQAALLRVLFNGIVKR